MQLIRSSVQRIVGGAAVVMVAVFVPALTPAWADFEESKSRLLTAVAGGDVADIVEAVDALKQFDQKESAELLVQHGLAYDDILVQRTVLSVLKGFVDRQARRCVADASTSHEASEVRVLAAQVCAGYGVYAYEKLKAASKDKELAVRSAAYRALAGHRKRATIGFLIGAMKDETSEAKRDIEWALEQLTGQEHGEEYTSWQEWWQPISETFEVPSLKEARKNDDRKDLGTAVRDGLYGPIESERVAFLFDVSGSMGVGIEGEGTRIKIAKGELQRVLENGLSPKSYFNIITFSDKVGSFGNGLKKASKTRVGRAVRYLEKLRAGGETNAFGAIKAAFDDKNVDTIYLLSDGQPTVGDETDPATIHETVAEWNRTRKMVIHCIGFFPGSAKNQNKKAARGFLKKLALDNSGVYLEVY